MKLAIGAPHGILQLGILQVLGLDQEPRVLLHKVGRAIGVAHGGVIGHSLAHHGVALAVVLRQVGFDVDIEPDRPGGRARHVDTAAHVGNPVANKGGGIIAAGKHDFHPVALVHLGDVLRGVVGVVEMMAGNLVDGGHRLVEVAVVVLGPKHIFKQWRHIHARERVAQRVELAGRTRLDKAPERQRRHIARTSSGAPRRGKQGQGK